MPNISVKNLSIEFRVFGGDARSFRKSLVSRVTGGKLLRGARESVLVRALDNVSLEAHAGDRVGLIGHNGSGKTTLLRTLAGLYQPLAGSITMVGSVGAMLDPFAGLDGDATGIENIFLRGRLTGMSSKQISENLDKIIQFSELGDFIHLPMRTYSAGMFARLSFSVSTIVQPDIILMDEGFGAGDAGFVDKMRSKLRDFHPQSILLLASHDTSLIAALCDRIIEFEHGKIIKSG